MGRELFGQGQMKRMVAGRVFQYIQQTQLQWREVLQSARLKQSLLTQARAVNPLLLDLDEYADVPLTADRFGCLVALILSSLPLDQQFMSQVQALLYARFQIKTDALLLQVLEFNSNEDLAFFRRTLYDEELNSNFVALLPHHFQSMLPKINLALSAVLCPQIQANQILTLYTKLYSNGLVEKVFEQLQVGGYDPSEGLKCISYLYQSLRFPIFRDQLHSGLLFRASSWKQLLGLFRISDLQLMHIISQRIPSFNRFLLQQGAVKRLTYETDLQLSQILSIYIGIARVATLQTHKQDLFYVYNFAINSLMQFGHTSISTIALSLISEVVRASLLTELSQIQITLKVFLSQDTGLIAPTLCILQAALKTKQTTVSQMFLTDRGFMSFLSATKIAPQLRFHVLEILYELTAQPKQCLRVEIFSLIENMITEDEDTLTVMSELLLRLVEHSLDSALLLMYLHEHQIIAVFTRLLDTCKPPVLNTVILTSIVRALHLLSVGVYQKHPNVQLPCLHVFTRCTYGPTIHQFLRSLNRIFDFPLNQNQLLTTFLKDTLNQKHGVKTKLRFCTIVCEVMQQLLIHTRQGSAQQRYKAVSTKRSIYNKIYELFSFTELLSNNIPIQIEIRFEIGERRLIRYIPYEFDFEDVKLYLRDFCVVFAEEKKIDLNSLKIIAHVAGEGEREIKTNGSYAGVLEKVTEDYKKTRFMLQLKLQLEQEEVMKSSPVAYSSWRNNEHADREQMFATRNPRRGISPTRFPTQSQTRNASPHFGTRSYNSRH